MVFIQNTYFDGIYDDVTTDTLSGSQSSIPTYMIPSTSTTPVLSGSTPPVLVPVSQSVAENNIDYLEALTNTARDIQGTIISTIMT